MATEEELKQNVLSALGVALKSAGLGTKVDVNQVLFVLSGRWALMRRGNVLDLEPIYATLNTQRGLAPQDAALVCLLLQRREDKLGVTLKMPAAVETMPAPARAELLMQVRQAPAAAPVKKEAPAVPVKKDPAPAPAPPAQKAGPADSILDAIKDNVRISKSTAVLLVVLTAAFLGINQLLKPTLPEPVTLAIPEVPNLHLIRDDVQAYAYDPDKDWALPQEQFAKVADAIYAKMEPMGVKNVYFCGNKDRTCSRLIAVVQRTGFTLLRVR